jgi:hypothetical protein
VNPPGVTGLQSAAIKLFADKNPSLRARPYTVTGGWFILMLLSPYTTLQGNNERTDIQTQRATLYTEPESKSFYDGVQHSESLGL